MNSPQILLGRIFSLLQRLQPVSEEYDVFWHGPYFIPRSGQWCPSTFMLYRGTLFVSLHVFWRWHGLSWRVGSDVLEAERGLGSVADELDEGDWQRALAQIERRLRAAVREPEAYNRRVRRYLPLSCRTGKIERCLSRELRPDALSAVQWDPIPALAAITPDQTARVRNQLDCVDKS